MRVVHTVDDLRSALPALPGRTLVPTMGNLHTGHLALVERARQTGGPVVASVFVNRLQFGPNEDFDRYPRTLQRDAEQLEGAGCDLLFAPDEAQMYPRPQTWRVLPDPALAGVLDGAARPGHFEGVATVVLKLFQLVQPACAVFGKKDYQQLLLVRDIDGLALSSRNAYLDPVQRAHAPQLQAALRRLADAASCCADPSLLAERERDEMQAMVAQGWVPDYLSVRRRADLQPPRAEDLGARGRLVVLGAARLGGTRLIDNVEC